MLPAHPMCLSDQAREVYGRMAEAMDDERLDAAIRQPRLELL